MAHRPGIEKFEENLKHTLEDDSFVVTTELLDQHILESVNDTFPVAAQKYAPQSNDPEA